MNRLFRIVDELCDDGVLEGKDIVAQVGFSPYQGRNYKTVDFFSREEHHSRLENAGAIISHAGVGSVVTALKMGKKVIVFPRLQEYHEHMDNHQLEICDYFGQKKYVLVAKNKAELAECIRKLPAFSPERYQTNDHRIDRLIIGFLEPDSNKE